MPSTLVAHLSRHGLLTSHDLVSSRREFLRRGSVRQGVGHGQSTWDQHEKAEWKHHTPCLYEHRSQSLSNKSIAGSVIPACLARPQSSGMRERSWGGAT